MNRVLIMYNRGYMCFDTTEKIKNELMHSMLIIPCTYGMITLHLKARFLFYTQ